MGFGGPRLEREIRQFAGESLSRQVRKCWKPHEPTVKYAVKAEHGPDLLTLDDMLSLWPRILRSRAICMLEACQGFESAP